MADKMPPLPEPAWAPQFFGQEVSGKFFIAAQMHAYARQHAAAVARPLVEALERLSNALARRDDGMQGAGLLVAAAHDDCRVALASFKETQP